MLTTIFFNFHPAGSHFSGRMLFYVLVLVALAAVPAAGQEVFVDPALAVPVDFVFTVDIAINCGGQSVKGVEVILEFDSSLLHLDAITPGPWFTGTGLAFFFFDYTGVGPEGELRFAGSVLDESNNQDLTLAVCHFTAIGFGSTPLDFLDLDVRDPANARLGFGHSTGDQVIIDPAVDVTVGSFGSVKALYR